jgi:hypothetical protein
MSGCHLGSTFNSTVLDVDSKLTPAFTLFVGVLNLEIFLHNVCHYIGYNLANEVINHVMTLPVSALTIHHMKSMVGWSIRI